MAAPGRPFVKGQTGNPGGRPKIPEDVKQLARGYSAKAIETLAIIMQDEAQTGAARVSAASTILDRAWGKAPQHITTDPLKDMSDDQLRDELAAVLDELRSVAVSAEGPQPASRKPPSRTTH